jgi:hypothetical protein
MIMTTGGKTMHGPDDEFRSMVVNAAGELASEEGLEELLGTIENALQADLEYGTGEDPIDDLAAVESWASVASYATARFHAPASPWPHDLAGWGKKAAGRLRHIANILSSILKEVVKVLKAVSFSIGVSFPWGISISVGW